MCSNSNRKRISDEPDFDLETALDEYDKQKILVRRPTIKKKIMIMEKLGKR